MLEQLERDGRFANQSCLLCHLGDHYYCANDTPRGKEKFRQALSIDEARFAEHPCDSLITWLAYGYRASMMVNRLEEMYGSLQEVAHHESEST